jgi:ribose 5-phosphate isomerase
VYSYLQVCSPSHKHPVSYDMVYTGFQSKQLIVSSDLNLGDVDQYPTIDVTLDGADE